MKAAENVLAKFAKLEQQFLASLRGSKPLIGYLCLRVPPELIEGYGGIPYRIIPRPGFDTSRSNGIRPDGCSFCRSVPAILDTDDYRGLSAIIAGSCCDQMRRLMDTLGQQLDIPVLLYGAPRTWQADKDYFLTEMSRTFFRLSETTGEIADEDYVVERIKIRNDLKALINQLRYEGQLSTALLHAIAASPLPPEEIPGFLRKLPREEPENGRVRLLLTGSIPGTWELDIIEGNGAQVVADATCLGDRVFRHEVAVDRQPISRLYDVYVEGNDCPHRRPVDPLIDTIKQLITDRQVEGVIYRSVKYCHPWGLLAERIKQEIGLPILVVDDDLSSPAVGNFRTRLGAFVEMLKIRARQRA